MPGHREVYEQALRQGNSAAWDQKWEQAITAYQRALTEFPGDPVAMDHLGLAYMQSGQLDQAQTVYQEADPRRFPKSHSTRKNRRNPRARRPGGRNRSSSG